MSDDLLIKADGLRAAFGKTVALDGVNLKVPAGRVTGLVGPDGAGKTTLLRLAAGLLKPAGGTLEVLGLDAAKDPVKVQEQVGYMPQKFGLYEDLTVAENLDLYADLQAVPAERRRERFPQLFDMTGLDPFRKRLAGDLSGGMKQKLGLACALVKLPRLLMLDEPTVGVDPVSRRDLWEIVYQMVGDEKIGVLAQHRLPRRGRPLRARLLAAPGQGAGRRAAGAFSRAGEGPGVAGRSGREGRADGAARAGAGRRRDRRGRADGDGARRHTRPPTTRR